MKIIKLTIACWCLLWSGALFAQVNIVSNSELENFSCNEGAGTCHHFDECVDDWFISHGTPNYASSNCPDNSNDKQHSFHLVCHKDKTEGVWTNIDLVPGPHRIFIRAVVKSISSSADINLRVSLDRNLTHSPGGSCQEGIADTDDTQLIYNSPLNEDGEWHWVIIDVDINSSNQFLDQLMITGRTSKSKQTDIGIDCIYMYRICTDGLVFLGKPPSPLVLESGSHVSCSYIESSSYSNSAVTTSLNEPVVLIANDYILLKPNFLGRNSLCARIETVTGELPEDFLPPCNGCEESDETLVEPPKGNDRSNEVAERGIEEKISIYPNPASNQFEIDLPEGQWLVTVFDRQGAIISRLTINQHHSITTTEWAKGLYLVEVINVPTSKRFMSKLVIQ